ncbi:thioredoxin [Secundilactobacillus yichangensis]|uniref:thioredoxin n=1 Tax=Secundilactobacillus yichangensis TaxID=2799580 RepID=UPI0019435DD2|nr:thioredoxin [Secundilactobacillus yichangensis]
MAVKPINDQNFNSETDSGLVVIDFNATWCPPCKMMNPIVEKMADDLADKVSFKSLDIDENQQTAMQMQVQGIPTFIVKKDGQIVDRIVGFTPEPAFKSRLSQYID